jgi:translation initiation factor eIF-2B subunit beta
MLWALPQHVRSKPSSYRAGRSSGGGTGGGGHHHNDHHARQESFGSVADLEHDPSDAAGGGSGGRYYPPGYYASRPDLKPSVMEAIQELVGELEDAPRGINEQAPGHVQSGEVVLTAGRSSAIVEFLRAAASHPGKSGGGGAGGGGRKHFSVLVCEGGAPRGDGDEGGDDGGGAGQARELARAGIDAVLIPDSSLFAVMSRVNKVLLPARAVLANGGLVSCAGCHLLALAARHHSVPVVCVSGLFKLAPAFPHDGQATLNDLVSPLGSLLGGGGGGDGGDDFSSRAPLLRDVEYVRPVHDYVPPELVRLYVTNVGSFQPNYTYRLLAEYYHVDDWESFE